VFVRHTTTHHNTLYHNDEIDEYHNYKDGEPRNSLILCKTLPDSYIFCEYECCAPTDIEYTYT